MIRISLPLALACALTASLAGAQPAPNPNLARNLAAQCANCHGTDGKSEQAIPALAGRPAADLIAAMAAFKAGTRPATIMHQLAKGYTDEQVKLMAEWFEKQK
jgi:cytochrome subunit of sulfide dehydrogenase